MNHRLISGLLVALGFMVMASEARADHNYPDSDGKVPIKWVCSHHPPAGRSYGQVRGDVVKRYIVLNPCYIRWLGGGWNDLVYIYRHEKAHSHGWKHYERSPEENPAYYPGYTLTGR